MWAVRQIAVDTFLLLLLICGVTRVMAFDHRVHYRIKRQEEQCPTPGDPTWKWKQTSFNCVEGKVYHCLENEVAEIVSEGCYIPKVCQKGTRPVVEDGRLECRRCPSGTFQRKESIKSDITTYNYCESHNPCKSDYGKKQCRAGTVEEDIGCECDVSQGYTQKLNKTECSCFTSYNSFCECEFTGCPEGTIQNEGQCVTQKSTTTTPTTTTSSTPVTKAGSSDTPVIAIVLPVVLLLIGVIIALVLLHRKWPQLWQKLLCHSVPGKPGGSLRATDFRPSSLTLLWSPVSEDGGTPVTEYRLEQFQDEGSDWRRVAVVSATNQPSCDVHNLTLGETYRFRVKAVNAAGESCPLESDYIIPSIKPSSPVGPLACTCGSDGITVTWKPPRTDGGAALQRYVIEKREVEINEWTAVETVDDRILTCTARGLTEGSAYIFRVMAENRNGRSDPLESGQILVKTPTGVPAVPKGPIKFMKIGPNSVTLAWSYDGGVPVKSYTVEMSDGDDGVWHVVETDVVRMVHTQEHLTQGQKYRFRVKAVNSVGPSEPLCSDVVEPTDKPSPPEGPLSVAMKTENSVILTWKPPASDGGSSIYGYVIDKREERRDVWTEVGSVDAEMLTITAEGLNKDRAYFFRVRARYERGLSSALVSSKAVTPRAPAVAPSEPVGPIKFFITPSTISMSWSRPLADGGAPVTSYTVELTEGDREDWGLIATVRDTFYHASGLLEDQSYMFRVKAVNAAGCSEPLKSETVTTKKKPDDKGHHRFIFNYKPVVSVSQAANVNVGDAVYVNGAFMPVRQSQPQPSSPPFSVDATDTEDVSLTNPVGPRQQPVESGSQPDHEETNPKTRFLPGSEETAESGLQPDRDETNPKSPLLPGSEETAVKRPHQSAPEETDVKAPLLPGSEETFLKQPDSVVSDLSSAKGDISLHGDGETQPKCTHFLEDETHVKTNGTNNHRSRRTANNIEL